MQTYRFCFTSESTYQLDSSDCKGKERSRTLKALANSHVSQTATCVSFSSHAAHFTHSSRMFAFFLPGQEKEWNQSCIVCLLSADSGEGGFKSVSSCAMCSVPSQLFLLKFLLFPVSIYVLTIKKGSLCFHFLSDSGNPDQRLWLPPWLYRMSCYFLLSVIT